MHGSVQQRVMAGTGACVQTGYRPRPALEQVGRLPSARGRPRAPKFRTPPAVARCARVYARRFQESGLSPLR